MTYFESPACDAIMAANHPTPERGGPCATCAFRPGTEAHRTPHTRELVRLCVEGVTEFMCHEQPRLCRGWIAAVNLKHSAGDMDDTKRIEVARVAAEMLAQAIEVWRQADERAQAAEKGVLLSAVWAIYS